MADHDSHWRGKRVLITGCTGFLGGAVARELFACGAEVVGLIHQRPGTTIFGAGQAGRVHFVHGRADNVFRLHSAMAVHEVAAVFHLASEGVFGAEGGTHAVIQAAKLYSRRVPVVTARPLQQLAIARTEEMYEDRLSVVRFGELFGPGDRKLFRVVPATAMALLAGEAPTMPTDGPARDFVFIRDAARACLLAAKAAATRGPESYSFRSGWLLTERQMAVGVRNVHACHSVDIPDTAGPINPLGWQPAQSLTEAIDETLAWYRAYLQTGCADVLPAAA